MKKKERLFKLTEKDFNFQFTRGRGKGGQHRNKTDTACICSHKPSGAEGYAEDFKEQKRNKRLAFERLTKTNEFKAWLNLKIEAAMGNVEIEENDDFGNKITRKVNHNEI